MPDNADPRFVRNVAAAASAIVATALVVAGIAVWELRADALADAERDNGNLATVFAEQTRQSIRMIDAALVELSEQLAVIHNTAPENYAEATRSKEVRGNLTEMRSRVPQEGAFTVVDAGGHVTNTSQEGLDRNVDLADREWFSVHIAANIGLNVSVPVFGRLTHQNVVVFSRRVETPQGAFLGVVAVGLPITSFEHIYGSIQSLTDQTFLLARTDGIILVRYPDSMNRAGDKLPATSPWYRVVAEGGTFYRTPGVFDGQPRLVAARRVGEFPLVITVAASEAAALAGWWRRTALIAAGTVLFLVCLILLLRMLAVQCSKASDHARQLQRQEQRLRNQNLQFKAALDNMGEGLSMFDAQERLIMHNDQFVSMYRFPPGLLKAGMPVREIMAYHIKTNVLDGDIGDAATAERIEALRQIPQEMSTSRLEQLADGRLIRVTRHPLDSGGWVATHEDVTDRHRHEARISFMAHHDLLTGLANRAFFAEKIEDAVARLRRHGEAFAVLMLDLDKFKNVNDTLGHPAGDLLLRETAQRLKQTLRETDVLARLGGDEFAIIQPIRNHPVDDADSLARRIISLISKPYDIDGNAVSIGTSIGIALACEAGAESTELLKKADLALYAAKAAGRNDFRFFDPEMLAKSDYRCKLEDELRNAISRGEFELHYQSVVDAATRRQAGFEALVRWRNPARGLVSPDQFIQLAEETGLIVPLGAWILQQACTDAAKWPPHIKVAVNLSPVQLAHPDLLQVILCALVDSSLAPERLELEITETALFNGDTDYVTLMRRLKKLGVSIVLDDFGTGYSSLSYLTMFPFDKIKIDHSFTANLTRRADCAAIVSAVLALGRSLETETVAEGVETEQQFRVLRAAGVTYVQGYLFGRACPVSDLVMDEAGDAALVGSAA